MPALWRVRLHSCLYFDAANAAECPVGKLLADHLSDFHAHPQRDRQDCLTRIAARCGVTLHCRLGAERLEINSNHTANRVDGAEPFAAGLQSRAARIFHVGDVGSHLGPDRNFGNLP